MQTRDLWLEGEKYLRDNAPELSPFMSRYGHCTIRRRDRSEFFGILAMGIASQQLPPEASRRIGAELRKIAGDPVTAEGILKLDAADLAAMGISSAKAGYLKDFAQLVHDKKVDLDTLEELSDAKAARLLTQVRGLGQWTAEIFLLLTLARRDILPGDDFLLKKEISELYHLDNLPKRGEMAKLVEHWRPWRSLGTWYLWQHSADIERI